MQNNLSYTIIIKYLVCYRIDFSLFCARIVEQLKAARKSITSEGKKADKLREKIEKLERSLEEVREQKKTSENAATALQEQLLEDHNNFRLQAQENCQKVENEKVR